MVSTVYITKYLGPNPAKIKDALNLSDTFFELITDADYITDVPQVEGEFDIFNTNNDHFEIFNKARVLNQLYCGSCVSASLSGAIEMYLHKTYSYNVDRTVSIQEFLDCRYNRDGTPYCEGAYLDTYADCNILLEKCNKYRCGDGCTGCDNFSQDTQSILDSFHKSLYNSSTDIMNILVPCVMFTIAVSTAVVAYSRPASEKLTLDIKIFMFLLFAACITFGILIITNNMGKVFNIYPDVQNDTNVSIIYFIIASCFFMSSLFFYKKKNKANSLLMGSSVFFVMFLRYSQNHIYIDNYIKNEYFTIYYICGVLATFSAFRLISDSMKKSGAKASPATIIVLISHLLTYSLMLSYPVSDNIYSLPSENFAASSASSACDTTVSTDCSNLSIDEQKLGYIPGGTTSAPAFYAAEEGSADDNFESRINTVKYMIQQYGSVISAYCIPYSANVSSKNVYDPVRNQDDVDILNDKLYSLSGHAIIIVGWTVVDDENVWIVRNSWGDSWAQDGFFYFKMFNPDNEFHSQALSSKNVRYAFIDISPQTSCIFPQLIVNEDNSLI